MSSIVIATADAGFFELVSSEVAAEGYEAVWAADGKEVLDLAAAEPPAMVLLDAVLPVFSGIEVCHALRGDPDLPGNLPIILLSDEDIPAKTIEQTRATCAAPKTHSSAWFRELLVEHLSGYRAH